MKDLDIKTVEDFFSVLLDASVVAHKFHLSTDKYSKHMALNDFYDDMPDAVDQLIEDYMGRNEKVGYIKKLTYDVPADAVAYFTQLLDVVVKANEKFDMFETCKELQSDLDDVVSLIDSTIYKLKNLS